MNYRKDHDLALRLSVSLSRPEIAIEHCYPRITRRRIRSEARNLITTQFRLVSETSFAARNPGIDGRHAGMPIWDSP
jgi:hypothetical protein